MKLSTKSEYALLAMADLAARYGQGLVSAADIAKRQRIPLKYLERLLLRLRKAGYLRSFRGAAGGCELAKDPEGISVAEVVRLMDGPIAPTRSASVYFYRHTPIEKNKALLKLFKDVREMVSRRLEKTTIRSLVAKQVSGVGCQVSGKK